ncbi:MAG: hypothetical protein R2822_22145 [Spirosomataceae bacterium]
MKLAIYIFSFLAFITSISHAQRVAGRVFERDATNKKLPLVGVNVFCLVRR